jgi:hypothetical protein
VGVLGLVLSLAGCSSPRWVGAGVTVTTVRAGARAVAVWQRFLHVPFVVDLTTPRSDGQLTVAANGRLFVLGPTRSLASFARGLRGYSTVVGPEPYIALATGAPVAGAACSFARDTVYALEVTKAPGVISVDARGHAHRIASLPGVAPNGIAFDDEGRFGHRLVVTAAVKRGGTTVFAVDCTGRVSTIASHAPTVEGGIVVAPSTFGSFAGDLIAPDELTGRVWAIGPDGHARLVARSPLASGQDTGVESGGFVPAGFSTRWAAYVADRLTPNNPHPGTDNILWVSGAELMAVGVRVGDLVIAGEGGAQTVAIRCGRICTIRHILDGPPTSHIEGHIVFAPQ